MKIEEIEKDLLSKIKSIGQEVSDEALKYADLELILFYNEYTPSMYARTNKLLNSDDSTVYNTTNGFIVDVGYSADFSYDTGAKPSGQRVLDVAMYGGHGADGLTVIWDGTRHWEDFNEHIKNNVIPSIKDKLISKCVPLR